MLKHANIAANSLFDNSRLNHRRGKSSTVHYSRRNNQNSENYEL